MTAPILVFGANGQVGHAMVQRCHAEDRPVIGLTRQELDVTNIEALRDVAAAHPGSPVINAAAYTAVDKAETEIDAAFRLNAVAPSLIAMAFGADRPVLHYSTDYVFDGTGTTPYQPGDTTQPLGAYGLSKRAGELGVQQAAHGTVIRTAWVYSDHGANFLKTMLRVGPDRGHLKVVNDQRGTPTHAATIADVTLGLLDAQLAGTATAGTYHLTNAGEASWFDFAQAIFAELEAQTGTAVTVEPIPSSDYPTPAARPAYSVLDCSETDRVSRRHRPDWRAPIATTVERVLNQNGKASS